MPQSEVGSIERALAVGDSIVFAYDPSAGSFELRGSDIEILALGVDVGADVSTRVVSLDALLRRARADDARALTSGLAAARDRGDALDVVVAFGDGEATTWLSVRGRRDDADGDLGSTIVGTMRDVSPIKRLEAEHHALVRTTEAILKTSSDVISIIDHDGVIREIGNAADRVLGAAPEDLVGGTVFSSPVVHPEDREHVADVYRKLLAGEIEHEESRYRLRTPEDDLRVVEGHRRVLRGADGEIAGVVVVVSDVTDHVKLERELLEARAVAESEARAKDALLSRISHEMRTPLNAVIGFGKLLAQDELESEQLDSVGQIVKAGEILLDLINEMLDISRAPVDAAEPAAPTPMPATMPATTPASIAGSTNGAAAPRAAATSSVLYIEDNASNLRLVERILAGRAEYELISATDGRTGLRTAREQRPTIVLLDLHLPDINGDVVLERLRSSPETRDTPVLMLSADATSAQIDRLRELGATDYLTKPLDIELFLTTLARLCATTRA